MWVVFALFSALFSALVAILSKMGLDGMNSTYATAIRTTAVMVITWLMVGVSGVRGVNLQISGRQLLFLVLSAAATGGAWLCYNRALQIGPTTRVASVDKLSIVLVAVLSAVFFKESMSWTAILSVTMIAGGTVLLVFS